MTGDDSELLLGGLIICAIILGIFLYWLLPGSDGLIAVGVLCIIVAFFSAVAFYQPIPVLIFGLVSAITTAVGLSESQSNINVAVAVIGIFVTTIILAIWSHQ